jgi:flavin reductase (DIM6/NTAB) family NADH-FMN oxidoreductase RutF
VVTSQSFRPDAGDPKPFRNALGSFATGVTIVTCNTENGPLGITANSFASVSLDPPLVLWSPARASKRFEAFEGAEHFAIHVLGEDQQNYCNVFATEGGNFADLDWQQSDAGVPLINSCLTRFECTRHAIHDGGDHAIIVGRVSKVTVCEGNSLVFSGGSFGRFEKLG